MKTSSRKAIALAFCAAICVAGSGVAAQDYPSKPIRLVVPYAAGGVTDLLARELAKQMSETLKQQIVVDNRTGAGGNIGAEIVAKSPADGYTLFFATNGPLAANQSLYAKLNFDPGRDFAPISLLVSVPYLFAAHSSLPAKNIKDLIQLLKANPGKYSFGSGGIGTAQHFAGELFKSMAGVDIQHIGYKGEAPAVNDLIGGHIPMLFASFTSLVPHIRNNTLTALAVTSSTRSSLLPDVPTLSESALPGYSMAAWFGMAAPAGTPRDIIQKINASAVKGLRSQEVMKKVSSVGGEAIGNTPEEFSAFIKLEIPRWAKLVKDSGARAD